MSDRIEVARAEPAEFETVLAILVEAAEWQGALGLRQWFPELFTVHLREQIEREVAAGDVHLARMGGETAGTVTLQWADTYVWGPREPDAGYIHRLAVRRAFAGRKVGAQILDWAAEQCAAAGKSFLRLDTMSVNLRLRAYYEELGFEFRGINPTPVWQPAMYERRVDA
ncbi:MAG TPA: GNAT family N-acetyltransferase [Chthonomonadaceae bacterium]|nr:GNAT family N-acetyltransferase [Chthonomonadaceae bacterium]